ncbi:MAG: GNAT family N-acetyltransferase [Chloroflexota bacterium]
MATDPTYCPVCSATLSEQDIGGRLRPACNNCGYVHYVNPVPGVGMLIEKDSGLVLIRRGHPPHQGMWTLPSGFVEVDESAEEAALREAEEETGLKTEIVSLAAVNSFPEGPPTSGIMIFYRMKPVGGALQAGDDADEVEVFTPENMPRIPFRTHREMVAEWLEWQEQPPNEGVTANLHTDRDFIIRAGEVGDMNEIGALLQLIPANREIQRDQWRAIVQRFRDVDGIEVYVAESRQSPPILMGVVVLSVTRSLTEGIGFINDMAVLPQFQRRGVGAALLEAVMNRARQLDLRNIVVNGQRANDQARAFYMASGFGTADLLQIKIR